MPDNIADTSTMPMYIGTGEGANPGFAYFGNGAVRRLTGNTELILLRDEFQVRTVTLSATDITRAGAISDTLFGI